MYASNDGRTFALVEFHGGITIRRAKQYRDSSKFAAITVQLHKLMLLDNKDKYWPLILIQGGPAAFLFNYLSAILNNSTRLQVGYGCV
jgi:hypothetical protein